MSIFALPPHLAAQTEAPRDLRADWITPEEQLHRLALPIAKELVYTNADKLKGLPDLLKQSVIECAVRSILRRSDLTNEGPKKRIPSLAELTVERLLDPSPLPPSLTTWYKALTLIGKLPEKVPPLPHHIHHIFEGKCPKQICRKTKPDGTDYKIKEKCTLILIPEGLGHPEECEKVVKAYGEKLYPTHKNPFQYGRFWNAAREQYEQVKFGPARWILHTDDVLEGSRNKTWDKQVAMVDVLAQETFTDWQIPKSFSEPLLAIIFTEIATGKRLYQIGNEQNGNLCTYGRVNQMVQGFRLCVGGSAHFGVFVYNDYWNAHEHFGVPARREFL